MTEPTQAQIEAAAKAMAEHWGVVLTPHGYEILAKAALTAAAEVGVTQKNFALLVWLEDVTRILRSGQSLTFTDPDMFDKTLLELERLYVKNAVATHGK